jgi:hypothetical protein
MFEAELAHRLSTAPRMPLAYHKAYVTALAWRSWFAKGRTDIRALNTQAAFQNAARDYYERVNA